MPFGVSGMIVDRVIESNLRIYWCLALGSLWAIGYLMFMMTFAADDWPLAIIFALGLLDGSCNWWNARQKPLFS